MNTNRRQLFLSVAALILAGSLAGAQARADDALNELSGGTNLVFSFASGADTAYAASAGYSRLLIPEILQGTLSAALLHPASNDTLYSLVVGPTLNISLDNEGIADAIYLTGALGFAHVSFGDASSTDFAHRIELGKRFPIVGHTVTWRPAFVASGTSASGSVEQFQVIPAQFSFLF